MATQNTRTYKSYGEDRVDEYQSRVHQIMYCFCVLTQNELNNFQPLYLFSQVYTLHNKHIFFAEISFFLNGHLAATIFFLGIFVSIKSQWIHESSCIKGKLGVPCSKLRTRSQGKSFPPDSFISKKYIR